MRKSKWVIVTLMVGLVVAFSGLVPASAASTTKKLSSNFTLVNLDSGTNAGTISYVKPDGSEWRASEPFSLSTLGEQLIRRQYQDTNLSAGRGSVVVTSDGPLGAVVQVQARDGQVPSFGAYSGVSDGASSVGVPLTLRNRNTASGLANSQIIIQNASSASVNVEVDLINGETGAKTYTKTGITIAPSAAYEYDLETESASNVPDGFFGSAVVRSTTTGGEIAVVANLFSGSDAMQTFNGFPQTAASAASVDAAQKWYIPLFTSRLANGLSTVVAVQNVSGAEIPINGIQMSCKEGEDFAQDTVNVSNSTAVKDTASFFFNPVTNTPATPEAWYGSCIVTTTGFASNVFVQMRVVNPNNTNDPTYQNAAAYEAMATGNDIVVVPLTAKRLPNGFATVTTIQNLSDSSAATVNLVYKASSETPRAGCSATINGVTIPAGGSILQNLRLPNTTPPITNSVPQLEDNCVGTLTVTSTGGQPINAFVQLTILADLNPALAAGDTLQAHNAFTISD